MIDVGLLAEVERVADAGPDLFGSTAAAMSRWVHLFAVIVAVGGTFFARVVLYPAVMSDLAPEARAGLRKAVMRRWSKVVIVAIMFILLSGIYNVVVVFPTVEKPMPYHGIFAAKALLALMLFTIAIGLTTAGAGFEGFQKKAPTWMAVAIMLAVGIVLLSVMLHSISLPRG